MQRKGGGSWTSCLGPSPPCIFMRAKSWPSPFFSQAFYPPKSMVAIQQPGKKEQVRPGSYLFPLSSAAILFTADTSRALWKVEKPGIAKGLVGTRVPRGVRSMGSLLVALLTAQSSQRNTFCIWLMPPQADTLCGCGLLWRSRYPDGDTGRRQTG